jgi:hypothetical protein
MTWCHFLIDFRWQCLPQTALGWFSFLMAWVSRISSENIFGSNTYDFISFWVGVFVLRSVPDREILDVIVEEREIVFEIFLYFVVGQIIFEAQVRGPWASLLLQIKSLIDLNAFHRKTSAHCINYSFF